MPVLKVLVVKKILLICLITVVFVAGGIFVINQISTVHGSQVFIDASFSDRIVVAQTDAPEGTSYVWKKNKVDVETGIAPTTFAAHFNDTLTDNAGQAPTSQTGINYFTSQYNKGFTGKATYPIANNLTTDEGAVQLWVTFMEPLTSPVYASNGGDPYILRYVDPASGYVFMINIKNDIGSPYFTVYNGSGDWGGGAIQLTSQYSEVPIDEPVMLTATYSRSLNRASFYVNGFKVASRRYDFDIPRAGDFSIGNANVIVDEVRFLNEYISNDEVRHDYLRGRAVGDNEIDYEGEHSAGDVLELSLPSENASAEATVQAPKFNNITPVGYVVSHRDMLTVTFDSTTAAACRYGTTPGPYDDLLMTAEGNAQSHTINIPVTTTVDSFPLYIKCGDDTYYHYRRVRVLPSINNDWPKIGKNFDGNNITWDEADDLSKYDLVSLSPDNLSNPLIIHRTREFNENILMKLYTMSHCSFDFECCDPRDSVVMIDLQDRLPDTLRLRNAAGDYIESVTHSVMLLYNFYEPLSWAELLTDHVEEDILSKGDWDGIYYDDAGIGFYYLDSNGPQPGGFLQSPDADGNGVDENLNDPTDYAYEIDLLRAGLADVYEETISKSGEDLVLHGNGASIDHINYFHGRTWETVLNTSNLSTYLNSEYIYSFPYWATHSRQPATNVNLYSVSSATNYTSARFGLVASLLGGVYFTPDLYEIGQVWQPYHDFYWNDLFWIDFTTAEPTDNQTIGRGYLGEQLGSATQITTNVWRRDFENGIVVLNNSGQTVTVDLGASYRNLKNIDGLTNGPDIVSSITLTNNDSRIFLNELPPVDSTPPGSINDLTAN